METPDGLRSIVMGLSMSSSAIGIYLHCMLLTVIAGIILNNPKKRMGSPNLKVGHFDRFFFSSATLPA